VLDRVLRLFSDVRAGEGATAVVMLLNLFLLFIGYYVMKVVRDATIVAAGGASAKAYSSAGQAVALMAFIPLYSWFAGRVDRIRLIVGMVLFFVGTLELFALGFAREASGIAVAFYVWVGIYNVAIPAQFWSFANDLYKKEAGERLFPVIAIGATAGAPLGAKLTQMLFAGGVGLFAMLQIAGAILLVTLVIFVFVHRRESGRPGQAQVAQAPIGSGQGFSLVFANPYLRRIALLLVLLNVVNTNGNFIMDSAFDEAATAGAASAPDPAAARKAALGELYGEFYFYQNIVAVLLQALLGPASSRCSACGRAPCLPGGLGAASRYGREHGRRPEREDRGERDRLLGHEHRTPDALAAHSARGEIQGEAGRGHLLRARRRRALRRAGGGGSGVARVAPGELRVAEPRPGARLARGGGGGRPREPAALGRSRRQRGLMGDFGI
jgi:hypothetical protein